MIKTKISVILYAVLLSAALMLPAFAIPHLELDHKAREKWEKRKLTEFPVLKDAVKEPKATFAQLDDYVDDHIGGSFQIIKFRKYVHYNYLKSTGDKYITRGPTGAMFLTAPFQDPTRNKPFAWWENLCVSLQTDKQHRSYAVRIKESYKLLSSRGAKVIYSSVPTKPGLIPLEGSAATPGRLKQACSEFSSGKKHIDAIENLVPKANFFYPFDAFKARISDPKFYPNTSYHWSGESGWVFAEEFAKKYKLKLSPKWDYGPCESKLVRWDIGRLTGVAEETPGCDRNFETLELNRDPRFEFPVKPYVAEIDDKLPNPIKHIRMVKFDNPHIKSQKTAVILSNSFGRNGADQLASLFKTTYHLSTNGVNVPKLDKLYVHSDFLDVDYIIVVAGDFHYPQYLNNVRVKGFEPG